MRGGVRAMVAMVLCLNYVLSSKLSHHRMSIMYAPNRLDDEEYIVGQVITVSVETVRIVKNLPRLET